MKAENIYLMIASSAFTDVRQLTDPPLGDMPANGDQGPAWSPTGEWIAFQRANDSVYVVHPDGSDLHRIGTGRKPRWSPDSTMLLVETTNGSAVIAVVDGHEVLDLTGIDEVQWSPMDGRIASLENGHLTMWSPDDGRIGEVAGLEPLGWLENLAWSPDGALLFTVSGNYGPVMVDLTTGRAHRLGPWSHDLAFSDVVWVDG